MAEYLCLCPPGFEAFLAQRLPAVLRGVKVLHTSGGLLHCRYGGDPAALAAFPGFSNSFLLLHTFPGQAAFASMVQTVSRLKLRYPPHLKGRFRVRFSKENQFVPVAPELLRQAEQSVQRAAGLAADRSHPQLEFWYILRKQPPAFYAWLLPRAKTQAQRAGELRPEIAYLMCLMARPGPRDTVLDPFSGYGAIPKQWSAHFPYGKLLLSDLDVSKVEALRRLFAKTKRCQLLCTDARALDSLAAGCVDVVITDPPWGLYVPLEDPAAFYVQTLQELRRVLRPGGRLVLLTACKAEVVSAASSCGFTLSLRVDTLVNGKKAAAFLLY